MASDSDLDTKNVPDEDELGKWGSLWDPTECLTALQAKYPHACHYANIFDLICQFDQA